MQSSGSRFHFRRAARILRASSGLRLMPRGEDRLAFVGRGGPAGGLLLDTCVYIDRMQNKLTASVRDLLSTTPVNHSSVAMQELLFGIGLLDPRDQRSAPVVEAVKAATEAMPSHRLFVPDLSVLTDAAVYAGILARTQAYAKRDRKRALNDCMLYLHALKIGSTVLTRNIRDFDLMLQLVPAGRVLFYRI